MHPCRSGPSATGTRDGYDGVGPNWLGLGCLWIIKDADRQAWHDKIAGTYVVKVPRNWPL